MHMLKTETSAHFAVQSERKTVAWYKDRFKGQRLFVCGNAPSIAAQYPLLREENTFAFNHFGLWDAVPFPPTFYGIGDWDNAVAWDNPYRGLGWEAVAQPNPSQPCFYLREKEDARATEQGWVWIPMWPKTFYQGLMFTAPFQVEPPFGAGGSTPINLGVQLGAYMGFNPIYLLGVEFGSRNEAVWGDSEEGKRLLALKPDKPYNPAFLDGVTDAVQELRKRRIQLINCTEESTLRGRMLYTDLSEVLDAA
jgi:hypothetical protein